MKLNEIYTYLKSLQVSVWLDNEQNKILLSANNSTLIEGDASYLVPLVDERTFVRQIKKTFQTSCDGWVSTRKVRKNDLDERIRRQYRMLITSARRYDKYMRNERIRAVKKYFLNRKYSVPSTEMFRIGETTCSRG